jgi:ubiquinone/menaquinone biosynthesis C-methylase UbiE
MNGISCSERANSRHMEHAPNQYAAKRILHWNRVALATSRKMDWGRYYRESLRKIYQRVVPPGQRILEIGCGQGDLLASLAPKAGVGIDFSAEMIRCAKERHPEMEFIQADACDLLLLEKFDVIILSDLVNELWDVQEVFQRIARMSTSQTRLILNFYSHLWEGPLRFAESLGLIQPRLDQNWLTVEDIGNLLSLADFQVIRQWEEIIWPVKTPVVSTFFNRYLARLWPFKHLALAHVMVARPNPRSSFPEREPTVSVVVPARNEAGNIEEIFRRVPEMGRGTELIFVEGHSSDDTYETLKRAVLAHPERKCRLFRQTGSGKGDAVRLGFFQAAGDIVMILDADLTVPPEDLPRFFEALRYGRGDFINGVRLVYPMEKQAMRFLNLLGNKFFSLAFSWILGQPIKDTLCGTKALWKNDYDRIAENRGYFGEFDPFGDFDLIFGAARLNMKIVDMPIRYRERIYGTTNIRRWTHGWLLIRMVLFAARRIKFV